MREAPQSYIVEALRAYLEENLADYISEVEEEVGESLPDYREYLSGSYDPFSRQKHPSLMVAVDRGIRDESERVAGVRVNIVTTHVDRDPAGLQGRQLWYTDALCSLLDEHHRIGNGVELVEYEEPNYFIAPAGQQTIAVTVVKAVVTMTYSRQHGIG